MKQNLRGVDFFVCICGCCVPTTFMPVGGGNSCKLTNFKCLQFCKRIKQFHAGCIFARNLSSSSVQTENFYHVA